MIAQHGIKDTRPRNFNCTECNESFMSKSAVNMHMQSHTGYRPIKCPECGHGFRSNTALAAHQRVHTGEKPFKCDLCAFSTKTKQLLSRHSRKHSGYKPYKCDHCTFSASCSAGLKRHQLQHTGSKPFQCPYCSYRSSNIENLRKHIKNTTKHTGLKIYPCHHCEFSCDQGSDYLKHMKRHFPYLDVDSESATKLAGILVSDHNEEIAQPVTSNFGNSEVQLSSGEDDDIHVEMLVNGHEGNAHEVEVRNKGSSNLAELDTDLLNALIKIPNLQKIILPQDSSNGPVTLVIGSDQPFPHLPDMYQEEDVTDVPSFKLQPNVSLNHSVNLG
uniref:C2H2-type domain-containing protein n=1 Tax=Ciona savignyi TaxID=51511 RepID=H2YGF8_CIOSA